MTGRRAILLSEIDVTFRHEAEEVVRRVYSELESRVRERTLDLERLNRELGEERQFVSAVVETVGSLLIVADAYGTVVRVNRALCELTGYSAEELTGRPIWETLLASPEAELVERAFASARPALPRRDAQERGGHASHQERRSAHRVLDERGVARRPAASPNT